MKYMCTNYTFINPGLKILSLKEIKLKISVLKIEIWNWTKMSCYFILLSQTVLLTNVKKIWVESGPFFIHLAQISWQIQNGHQAFDFFNFPKAG